MCRFRAKQGDLKFVFPQYGQLVHLMKNKIIAAVKRMQQLGQVISSIAVAALLKELASWVDQFDEAGSGIVEDVAAAEISMDSSYGTPACHFADAVLHQWKRDSPSCIHGTIDHDFF